MFRAPVADNYVKVVVGDRVDDHGLEYCHFGARSFMSAVRLARSELREVLSHAFVGHCDGDLGDAVCRTEFHSGRERGPRG